MKHFIIGTAGHVDHGKSALIRAITGAETDRLPEERQRGISIDIGFAQFVLPSGRKAGVIDVPGHERFIKNMLAGITGIDLVLMVVAADEGVMPQTREHLDILRLLDIKQGIIVLTKKDLVDQEFLALVADDVQDAVQGTFLEHAPVVAVSSITGEGIPKLLQILDQMLETAEPKDVTSFARLPVDRAFVKSGFGTVVTGTLVSGVIREGDRMLLQPQAQEVRVRGLQVHSEPVQQAQAGQRVAVNLAGIERRDVRRGHVLCAPDALRPTTSVAGRLHLLASWPKELKHGTRVHLHTGASDVLARVLLLQGERMRPGETSFVQLKTEEPVVIGRGDRYIIRSFSPVHTMGGGVILDPHSQYKKSQAAQAIQELRAWERGGTSGVIRETLLKSAAKPLSLAELSRRSGIVPEVAAAQLKRLESEVRALEGGLFIHQRGFEAFLAQLKAHLEDFHRRYPLRQGPAKEEVRRRMGLGGKEYGALLSQAETDGEIAVIRDRVAMANHAPSLSSDQRRAASAIAAFTVARGYSPPTIPELKERFAATDTEELVIYLTEQGQVVRLTGDLILHASVMEAAAEKTREYLKSHGQISLAQFRDLLGTTRKYALPLLEWMDEQQITRRSGDQRLPGPNV